MVDLPVWQKTQSRLQLLKKMVPEPPRPTRGRSSPKCGWAASTFAREVDEPRQNPSCRAMAGGIERTAGRMNLEIDVTEIARPAHNSQPWPSRRGPPVNLSRTAFPCPGTSGGYVRPSYPWRLS